MNNECECTWDINRQKLISDEQWRRTCLGHKQTKIGRKIAIHNETKSYPNRQYMTGKIVWRFLFKRLYCAGDIIYVWKYISGPSLQWGWTTATDDLLMFTVRFPVLTRHFLPTNEFHPSKTKKFRRMKFILRNFLCHSDRWSFDVDTNTTVRTGNRIDNIDRRGL